MPNIVLESFGNVISLKDEETDVISIQIGDNIYEADYKGKQLFAETNSLLFLGADNFLGSNNLAYKKKSNNYVYNYQFNADWVYNKSWGSKKITILKESNQSYYNYEEYYQQDFNGDEEIGIAYNNLEESGNIFLLKDSLSNLYVNDSSSQIPVTQKNGNKIKYQIGKYLSVAAEQNGGMNLLVQKHSSSNNLKIFYSDSGDWSYKKNDYYFEKKGTYEYYDAEILFGVDFDEDGEVGYNLEIIDNNGSQSLKKDSYGNLYLVEDSFINPLFYKNGQLKNNFLSNKTPIAVEIIDDDPKLIWENNKNGDLNLWTFDEEYIFESSSLIKFQSAEYFETEILFSQDFDGDEKTGFSFNEPFEADGSIYLVTDQLGNIYIQSIEEGQVVDTDPISFKGNQIYGGYFNGFTILGAESFSNSNYLALENNTTGGIKIYSADEEWNLLKTSFIDLESNDYFDAEDNFQQDFDGDGVVGYDFSIPFENSGDTYLAKDQVDNIFAYNGKVADSKKNPIFYKGSQLNNSSTELPNSAIFENFDLLGAEKINQENYVALESVFTGDLAIWNLSDSWNYSSFEKVVHQSTEYYLSEFAFSQDFNGDEIIGFSYSEVESEGNVDLLFNDQFGEAYVSTTAEKIPDIFTSSANFEKEAITYKGLNVSESDEFSIFGDSLIAAETIENTNKVAWEKSDNDLTIWDMNSDWSFDSTSNVQFQSFEYFQYESQFNLDFDGDGNVGVTSETVENDKFVELITDNIGSVSIKINGNDEELFPTYNSEKINTNNFSELTILAADTNLYKNKIVNQIAWAEKDSINNIVNIELWEMDSDWNFVSSETISKNLDDEIINSEYQLQELAFDTDFDQDGDVGNGYFGFYLFSVQEDSTDLKGNTFLKTKTLDDTYIAENSESSWEIKYGEQTISNTFDFSQISSIEELSNNLSIGINPGDYSVLAVEEINGKNNILIADNDWVENIFILEADLNWQITDENTNYIYGYSSEVQNIELLFNFDLNANGKIGPGDFEMDDGLNETFTLEDSGSVSIIYDKQGDYKFFETFNDYFFNSMWINLYLDNDVDNQANLIKLNKTNFPDINLIAAEFNQFGMSLLLEENEKIKIYYSTSIKGEGFVGGEGGGEGEGLDQPFFELILTDEFLAADLDQDIYSDTQSNLVLEMNIDEFINSELLNPLEDWFMQDLNSDGFINNHSGLLNDIEPNIVKNKENQIFISDIAGEYEIFENVNTNLNTILDEIGGFVGEDDFNNTEFFDYTFGLNSYSNSEMKNPYQEIYEDYLISVTKKNKPLVENSKSPWEFIYASTVSDQNKMLLKHKKNNSIKVWDFDENWNYINSSKIIKKFEQIIQNENLFNFDINNDGIIGEKFEKLELNGEVQMLKDQGGFLYSKISSEGNAQSITKKNKMVKFNNLGGYEVVCIDQISGNKVVTKHKKKNILKIWEADESWALTKKGKAISSKNDLFFEEEIIFNTDFDNDDKIGFVFENIDSDGLVMQKNQNGYASVIVDENNKYLTNKKGNKISYKKGNWEISAAEIVGDKNQIVVKHKNNKKINIWSMDDDWKFSSVENKLNNSDELFFEKETLFGSDFDNDGDIGLIYSEIENQGLVLQKNQLGNVSIINGDEFTYLKNKKGNKIYFKTKKWELAGAETINESNQAVWKNSGNGNLNLWTLDENWKKINNSVILAGSQAFNELQLSFDQTF